MKSLLSITFTIAALLLLISNPVFAQTAQSGNFTVDLSAVEAGQNKPVINSIDEELLQNPGFETGSMTPWYHDGSWMVIDSGMHTGSYCAYDVGNHWIRQDITATPQSDIISASLWMRQPEQAISAIWIYYSNMGYSSDLLFINTSSWLQYDITSFINTGGIMTGIQIWGYSGGGPDPDQTFIDDISIQTAYSPELVVTLTPINPPIIVPSGGGTFDFTAQVENTTTGALTFDAWIEAILPNGAVYGPIILRTGLNLPGSGVILRQLGQYVPGGAPAGNYYYAGRAGTYPSTIVFSDSFAFSKLLDDFSGPGHSGCWRLEGWDDETATLNPAEFGVMSVYPNPFNPETVARFELRDASQIRLTIYDIAGREVAVLADGWHPAGTHQVVWDASAMASGVYFARLQAGANSRTAKLLLMK